MTDFIAQPLTPAENAEAARLARQESLNLRLPRGVLVVGCGGVGSWIAYFLALAGCRNLWLFDGDLVSDHNRNRLLVPPSAIGKPKSEAVADTIRLFRPDAHLISLGAFSPELA